MKSNLRTNRKFFDKRTRCLTFNQKKGGIFFVVELDVIEELKPSDEVLKVISESKRTLSLCTPLLAC
jgi:hypothetical protein